MVDTIRAVSDLPGLPKKKLCWMSPKRLQTLVETQLGAEVVMTRDSDTFVPLESRTQMANDEKADLFLSIHVNSSPEKSVRGRRDSSS
jgi:N-acetylmuramoyl-L-alanine amidase